MSVVSVVVNRLALVTSMVPFMVLLAVLNVSAVFVKSTLLVSVTALSNCVAILFVLWVNDLVLNAWSAVSVAAD